MIKSLAAELTAAIPCPAAPSLRGPAASRPAACPRLKPPPGPGQAGNIAGFTEAEHSRTAQSQTKQLHPAAVHTATIEEDIMKALHRSRTLLAAIPLAGIALAAVPAAAVAGPAAARPHTVHVSGRLTVAYTAPPVCTAGVCIINNQGTGTLAAYGPVTFTTVITADGNQPPCGATSQWVNRIIRTITTSKGTLVLHEAGLQCPLPGVGPQVKAVWAADGADSTGIFAGASGQGSDTAYPALNTAAPRGTLTLSP